MSLFNGHTNQVMVLSASGEFHDFKSLKRVISLYMAHKIVILKFRDDYDGFLHPSLKIGWPTIIMLTTYHKMPSSRRRITPKRKRILIRDDHTCQYCKTRLTRSNATIDHVVPKADKNYPGHIWTNVVASCETCNHKKRDRTPTQAGMRLLRKPKYPRPEDLYIGEDFKLELEKLRAVPV